MAFVKNLEHRVAGNVLVALSAGIHFALFIDTFVNAFATSILYDILQLGCVVLFFAGVILGGGKIIATVAKMTAAIIVFNTLYYLAFYDGQPFLQKYGLLFMSWFPLLLAVYCVQMPAHIRKRLWSVAAVLICVTCLTTLYALATQPYVSKMLANPEYQLNEYNWRNIGGYQFIYLLMALLPMLVANVDADRGDAVSWVTLALSIVTIVMSQYTIALILGLLSIAAYFVTKQFNGKRILLFLAAMLVLFFLVRGWLPWGAEALASSLPDSMSVLGERLVSFAQLLAGSDEIGTASFRLSLYIDSLWAFAKSYLMGNFFVDSGIIIWGHSGILDLLGMTGLLGAVMLCVVVYQYIKEVYAHVAFGEQRRSFQVAAFTLFAFALINPLFGFPSIVMAVFLIPVLNVSRRL